MSGWRVEVKAGGSVVVGGKHSLYVNPWERIGELNGVAVCTFLEHKDKNSVHKSTFRISCCIQLQSSCKLHK